LLNASANLIQILVYTNK